VRVEKSVRALSSCGIGVRGSGLLASLGSISPGSLLTRVRVKDALSIELREEKSGCSTEL